MGPNDWWIAECVPCKWEQQYASQDSAIFAVEEHVQNEHRHVNAAERADKKIGHVQMRTVDELPRRYSREWLEKRAAPDSAGDVSAAGGAAIDPNTPFPPDTTRGQD